MYLHGLWRTVIGGGVRELSCRHLWDAGVGRQQNKLGAILVELLKGMVW